MFTIGLIIGLLVGTALGIVICAVSLAAGDADASMELEEGHEPRA